MKSGKSRWRRIGDRARQDDHHVSSIPSVKNADSADVIPIQIRNRAVVYVGTLLLRAIGGLSRIDSQQMAVNQGHRIAITRDGRAPFRPSGRTTAALIDDPL